MRMDSQAKTVRMFEAPNAFWRNIYQNWFGTMAILCSVAAWIVTVVWLDTEMGGFGTRPSDSVTAAYFNWHPLLMTTGFLLFMTPAVLSFELFPFLRSTNKNLHGFLMLLATLSAFAGLAIIIDCHKNLSTTGNFQSVHGCLGLITMVGLGINYLGGFIMYGLKLGGKLRVVFKPMHKRLGLCVVLLGLANCTVGIMEKSTSIYGESRRQSKVIACLIFFVIIGILFTVSKFMDKADGGVEYSPIGQKKSENYGSKDDDDQL